MSMSLNYRWAEILAQQEHLFNLERKHGIVEQQFIPDYTREARHFLYMQHNTLTHFSTQIGKWDVILLILIMRVNYGAIS